LLTLLEKSNANITNGLITINKILTNIIQGEFGILQLLTDEFDVLVGASAEKDGF
jgi:hypothetical protein